MELFLFLTQKHLQKSLPSPVPYLNTQLLIAILLKQSNSINKKLLEYNSVGYTDVNNCYWEEHIKYSIACPCLLHIAPSF